jgi:hypothetical protein
MLADAIKPIRLECYLPRLSGVNKVSLFRADSLARYLLQCAWDSSAVAMDKTVVGLNIATHPDKCWFVVLCRFWLLCSRTLTLCNPESGHQSETRTFKTQSAAKIEMFIVFSPSFHRLVCCCEL